jgi:hypothetical protein
MNAKSSRAKTSAAQARPVAAAARPAPEPPEQGEIRDARDIPGRARKPGFYRRAGARWVPYDPFE